MGKDSTWGYEPHLTEEQREALGQFREKVKTEIPPKEYLQKDSSLLRYLRARNFNVQKAWTMLKEDVEWRDPFEGYVFQRERDFGGAYALHEMGAIRLTGTTKKGNPIITVLARANNPRLVEDNIQIVYFFVFYVDELCRRAEAVGEETFYGIFDLEGFSLANFSLSQMKVIITILQNHYPERLGTIFVINAPWVFGAVWRMIKPLLDERTRHKIEILGGDYIGTLSEHIDLDQIEEQYGGKHAKFAIPDDIVRVALENEQATLLAVPPAPTSPPQSVASGNVAKLETSSTSATFSDRSPSSHSLKTPKAKKSKVKLLLRKMLFLTDKREEMDETLEEASREVDVPQAPEELASATMAIEIERLNKSLLETRVEQDKFAAQIAAWKAAHEAKLTGKEEQLKFLQFQVLFVILLALAYGLYLNFGLPLPLLPRARAPN